MEKPLADLRENYGQKELLEENCPNDPILFFDQWLNEALETIEIDANAMTIVTVNAAGQPSARTVLLKAVTDGQFLFFTHYTGLKGIEISENNKVAILFWWKELERQVRIEGTAERISRERSEAYFHTRPKGSQIGAVASPQSQVITREALLDNFRKYEELFKTAEQVPLPENWGGYAVTPTLIEFWQGRPNRLHDRIQYTRNADHSWKIERLAP